VSGDDVYVAGYIDFDNEPRAILWKNGVPQALDDVLSVANSVYVVGESVYVAGMAHLGGEGDAQQPVLWSNGDRQNLNATGVGGGEALSVFVSESNDVYVAGYYHDSSMQTAALWKNGDFQDLVYGDDAQRQDANKPRNAHTWTNHDGYLEERDRNKFMIGGQNVNYERYRELREQNRAHSVFVSKGDVYVAGQMKWGSGPTASFRGTLWINGKPKRLGSLGGEEPRSVFVSNGTVYVADTRVVSTSSYTTNAEFEKRNRDNVGFFADSSAPGVFVPTAKNAAVLYVGTPERMSQKALPGNSAMSVFVVEK
jgi:hypothetical protein